MNINSGHILVVDDHEMNRQILGLRLQKRGFQISEAESGLQALKLIDTNPPDLVLLDIMMPGIDGYEILTRIRQTFSPTDMPVIMVTAKDMSQDVVRALELGANDYVTKPVDFAVTLARIQSQLSLKRSEEALKDSEARYRDLFENASDLIQIVQTDGTFLYTNRAWKKTLGYTDEDLSSRTIWDIIHPRSKSHCEQLFKQLMHGQEINQVEAVFLDKSGKSIDVDGSVSLRKTNGTQATTRGIFRDVTMQKAVVTALEEAKEAAEKANQTKSQFLASMSHELRTPLNSVIGFSNILLKNKKGNLDQKDLAHLERIQRNGKHLLSLINDVLDLSKIEAGKMELELRTFDINEIIDDVVSVSLPLIAKNDNTLQVEVDPKIGDIHADATRLKQCLLNLLSNASKFTENGQIEVVGSLFDHHNATWIRLEVRDTGIGMTAQTIESLFQPFTQADASTSRKYGGTGLGLTISKHFCQMMGGDIYIKSTPDKGSTFIIELPTKVCINTSDIIDS